MTIHQRWKQTALHNKLLVIVGGIAAIGAVISAIVPLLSGEAPISQHSAGQLSPNIVGNRGNIIIHGDTDQTKHSSPDFESVVTWSVSFKIGGFILGRPLDIGKNVSIYVIGLPECQFYNLSTTQRRLIDLKLVVSTKIPKIPTITPDTQNLDFLFKRPNLAGLIYRLSLNRPESRRPGRLYS